MTKREDKALDLKNKGMLVVFSGPSGCGKDTVLEKVKEKGCVFDKTVSVTTRTIRSNETDGVDYYFTSKEDFQKKIDNNEFVEYTLYSGNYYGTLKTEVENRVNKGGCVLLKIEVEGAENIKKAFPEAVSIFIFPPSKEELKKRLIGRGTETEESLNIRYSVALKEMEKAPNYDYVVINDNVDLCAEKVCSILEAEKTKYLRMQTIIDEILNK